jgi:hypothetical protein
MDTDVRCFQENHPEHEKIATFCIYTISASSKEQFMQAEGLPDKT